LRLPEWEGAILLAQLERLPEATRLRDENARYLGAALAEIDGIKPLVSGEGTTQHARHLFVLRYDPAAFGGRSRDAFIAALKAEGITPCMAGYIPLSKTPMIRETMMAMFGPESLAAQPDCPVAERAGAEAVWLSQHVLLGDRRLMDDIVEAVRKIQRAWRDA
jgi:dTDP-4-amino-4,6-dideoxygalactose transaminase